MSIEHKNFNKENYDMIGMNIEKIDIDRNVFSYCDKDHSRIYCGFGPYMTIGTIYEYITRIMRKNPGYRVPPNLEIEFIPTFHISGKQSFREWLDENKHSQDAETAFKEFALASQTPEAQKAMDAYWEGHEFHNHANLYMLPVVQQTNPCFIASENIVSHMQVPHDAKAAIQQLLEVEYGVGNVYVANQIQPLQNVVESKVWHFFLQQGCDALYDGIIYNRSEFDDQSFNAGDLVIPVYGIPITIKRGPISRHVDADGLAQEYRKTMQNRVHIPQMSDYAKRMVGSPMKMENLPLWDNTDCMKNISRYVHQYVTLAKEKSPRVYEHMVLTHNKQLYLFDPPAKQDIPSDEKVSPLTRLFHKVVKMFCRR